MGDGDGDFREGRERGVYLFVEIVEEIEWDEAKRVHGNYEGQREKHRSLDSLDGLRGRSGLVLEGRRLVFAFLECWWSRLLFRPPSFDPQANGSKCKVYGDQHRARQIRADADEPAVRH